MVSKHFFYDPWFWDSIVAAMVIVRKFVTGYLKCSFNSDYKLSNYIIGT